MRQQTKDMLIRFDEFGSYETPTVFDYKEIKSNVSKLTNNLIEKFGVDFIMDDQIQDASFFCDIKLPHNLVINPKPQIGYSIRISNFGQLATINFETEYTKETVQTIINILDQNGFVYISADELDEDYDGSFTDFYDILGGETPSWGIRYFDYL